VHVILHAWPGGLGARRENSPHPVTRRPILLSVHSAISDPDPPTNFPPPKAVTPSPQPPLLDLVYRDAQRGGRRKENVATTQPTWSRCNLARVRFVVAPPSWRNSYGPRSLGPPSRSPPGTGPRAHRLMEDDRLTVDQIHGPAASGHGCLWARLVCSTPTR